MNSVEKIMHICKERGIAISKLERELTFSNGYFRGLRKGNLPAERLAQVAEYLNVSVESLLSDKAEIKKSESYPRYYTDSETARLAQEAFDDPDMKALFHMKRNMNPETFKAHLDMMKRMYQLEHPEDDDDFTGC